MAHNRSNFITAVLHVFLIGIVALSLGACSRKSTASANAERQTVMTERSAVSASALSGLDARAALALANTWKTTEKGVTSFVDTKKISFEFADGTKATVPLPDPKMVVAIAPYINNTHPCETHYLSGCQGEMVNIPVKVYGKTNDGLVVVDDTITTLDNGFFELWLARDLEIVLTIEYNGKRAVQTITTNKNSNTCITTMRLI